MLSKHFENMSLTTIISRNIKILIISHWPFFAPLQKCVLYMVFFNNTLLKNSIKIDQKTFFKIRQLKEKNPKQVERTVV